VSESLGLPHISSGDLFRENIREQTELGTMAEGYLNRGELVPDDVTVGMVRDRLQKPDCADGGILDGFPRTTAQAEALDKVAAEVGGVVETVVLITVPEETLVERLSGRWMSKSGRVYHSLYNPPKVAGKDDIDGSDLYQREDDKPETVRNRIRVYEEQTAPLVDFYRKRDVLLEVNGDQAIESVTAEILEALKA
jgi:adenylate kinase